MVAFYPTFCLFQDLSNGRVLGIGKEEEGLYLLTSQIGGIQKQPTIKEFAVNKEEEYIRT